MKKGKFGCRRTTNKPVAEMEMFERALNNCCVVNHNTVYRDYDGVYDIRNLIKVIAANLGVNIDETDPLEIDFLLNADIERLKMEKRFKVGDRVKKINGFYAREVGTIKFVDERMSAVYYAVELDRNLGLHDCQGHCKAGHGYWGSSYTLERIDREFKLIIISNGDTTTAKLIHGKGVDKEATVKRYYKDKYSEKVAVQAVCEKIYGDFAAPQKGVSKTGGINCKAVYIGETRGDFTRGKVYEFKDGQTVDDNGYNRPLLGRRVSEDSEWFSKFFVKMVEEN